MSKTEQMYGLVESYKSSGLSREAFCADAGVSTAKFAYWYRKYHQSSSSLASSSSSSSFIPLNLDGVSRAGYELVYPNGVRLLLPELDLSVLKSLLCLV